MADEHQIAIAALFSSEQHVSLRRSEDRCSLRASEIEAVVMLAIARSESRDDHAAHGPGERLTTRGGIERVSASARDLRRRGAVRGPRFHPSLRRIGRRNDELARGSGNEQPGAHLELRRVGEPVGALHVVHGDAVRPRDPPERLARLHAVVNS